MIEKYFVTSSGDAPDQIFFDLDSAKEDDSRYIDSFDEKGIKVESYKRLEDGTYTTDF